MPATQEQIMEKMRRKLRAKADRITANWNAAKPRMKEGYAATPFNAAIKDSYNRGIDAAVHRVDVEKAITNYQRKMF